MEPLQPAATVGIAWLGYCRRHGIIMRIVKIIIKKIVGRERFGRSTPAMSRLNNNNGMTAGGGVGHSSESGPAHSSSGGRVRWFNSDPDWQQFHQYLLQRMTPKTAEDRLRYAKQYASVLTFSGIPESLLQLLSPNKRIHVMKALSAFARYTGQTEKWRQIRLQHGLQWSTGTEKLDAFTRFFDYSKDLDTMLAWFREALQVLPPDYSNFYLFCTLTGLRASECLEAVRLLLNTSSHQLHEVYYNPEQQVLQHYRFPHLFIRSTKAVFVSVVNDQIVGIAKSIKKIPTINALKMAVMHRKLSMRLKYCRKIYASWLHKSGISESLIDMLQGRIGKNIFLRHYLTPSSSYKTEVLKALEKLQRQL